MASSRHSGVGFYEVVGHYFETAHKKCCLVNVLKCVNIFTVVMDDKITLFSLGLIVCSHFSILKVQLQISHSSRL